MEQGFEYAGGAAFYSDPTGVQSVTGATASAGTATMIMPGETVTHFGPRPQDGLHYHIVAPPPCQEAFCAFEPEGADLLGVMPVTVAAFAVKNVVTRQRRLHQRGP